MPGGIQFSLTTEARGRGKAHHTDSARHAAGGLGGM